MLKPGASFTVFFLEHFDLEMVLRLKKASSPRVSQLCKLLSFPNLQKTEADFDDFHNTHIRINEMNFYLPSKSDGTDILRLIDGSNVSSHAFAKSSGMSLSCVETVGGGAPVQDAEGD